MAGRGVSRVGWRIGSRRQRQWLMSSKLRWAGTYADALAFYADLAGYYAVLALS